MKKFSTLLIIAAGCMWGCMGILVRTLEAVGLNSMETVALRSILTCICMVVGLGIFKRKAFSVKVKDIWCFLGTGIASVVFFNYCYFRTITMTSLSVAAVLLYTAPTFVMLMSAVLFKEKLTMKKGVSLVMAFLGCVLVTGGFGTGSGLNKFGILIGLGAGLGYALYTIFGRYAIERGYDSFTITLYTFFFASLGVLPFVNIPHIYGIMAQNPSVFLQAFFWTFVTTVAAYLCYTLGLKYMEAGKASVIASIEPVAATLIGVFLFQETIEVKALLGMCLVLGATLLVNKRKA